MGILTFKKGSSSPSSEELSGEDTGKKERLIQTQTLKQLSNENHLIEITKDDRAETWMRSFLPRNYRTRSDVYKSYTGSMRKQGVPIRFIMDAVEFNAKWEQMPELIPRLPRNFAIIEFNFTCICNDDLFSNANS